MVDICEGIGEVKMVKLIKLESRVVLLAITPEQVYHFRDVVSGEEIANVEHVYAEQRARIFLGDSDAGLVKIIKLEEFGGSSSYINRFLPAYRVDLRNAKLASYDDRFGRLGSKLFQWFHTWSFLGGRGSAIRVTAVSMMSLGAFLLSLSGVVSLFVCAGNVK